MQTIISEVGMDMSRWNTEKQFSAWLGLCPDNRISGGKILKSGTRRYNSRRHGSEAAAWILIGSQRALGANFRTLRSKVAAPKAITANGAQVSQIDSENHY